MECYVCYETATSSNPFFSTNPCQCKGTVRLHKSCFEKLRQTCGETCGICKSKYKNTDNRSSPRRQESKNYVDLEFSDLAIAQALADLDGFDFPTGSFTHREIVTPRVQPREETYLSRELETLRQENKALIQQVKSLSEDNKTLREVVQALSSRL